MWLKIYRCLEININNNFGIIWKKKKPTPPSLLIRIYELVLGVVNTVLKLDSRYIHLLSNLYAIKYTVILVSYILDALTSAILERVISHSSL